jgi:hypothetical protein
VAGVVSNILTGGAATQTNAGTYGVTADFTPADTTNYNSLTGASAGNFVINQKNLTVTGITADNKVYDGTTAATINVAAAALNGVVAGDTVTLNTAGATGAFDNPDVGNGKTVTISGLTIGGADVANYSLTQPTTTANITADGTPVTPTPAPSSSATAIELDSSLNLFLNPNTPPSQGPGGTFTPGQAYFYQPVIDTSLFDSMILDASAYEFVNGQLILTGHAGLLQGILERELNRG